MGVSMYQRSISVAVIVLCCFAITNATVEPAGVFSDSMVLQRDIRVPLWGWAAAGEVVTVTYNGQTVTATARDSTVAAYKGYWKAWLQPMSVGGPYDLTITGSISTTPITFKSILVGDVWVCSGQSNMWYSIDGEYATDNTPDMMALPPDNQPLTRIRMCRIGTLASGNPALDLHKTNQWGDVAGMISAPWRPCSRANARQFSAAADVFGITIYTKESVPIGLILAAVGGTGLNQWVSQELGDTIVYRQCANKPDTPVVQRAASRFATGANFTGNGVLFAGMISPLVGLGIKGVIWWQGENEGCDNPPVCDYTSGGFRRLIREWRHKWAQGNFPFIYVQLQQGLWCTPASPSVNEVEDQQMQALAEPNTGMGICFDSISGTHPGYRYLPAMRMAIAAREVAYGEDVEGMGPIYSGMSIEGAAIRIRFAHLGGGLIKKAIMSWQGDNSLAVGATVLSSSQDANAPFEIAGADNIYHRADAAIDQNTVVVSSPAVASPKNVRYGVSVPSPAKTPLYNADGLPASMFRTATWAGLGNSQTVMHKETRNTAGAIHAGGMVFKVVNGRFVVPKDLTMYAKGASAYDVKGKLIGKADAGANGTIKIDNKNMSEQTILLRLHGTR
jgi:sialate O-acetylesterase